MDFSQVYDAHFHQIRTFILKMVGDEWIADDLSQETFIRVRKKLDGLRDFSKLKSWIFRIARNLCLDYFRSRVNKNTDLQISDAMPGDNQSNVQMKLEQNQMSSCVVDKIDLLPETLKEVLVLSEIEELNHQEIADILNINVGNVKVRLHRARRTMKEILQDNCRFERDERNVMICQPM